MTFVRYDRNPIITPDDVKPSRPDFEVIGAFNAGVATCQDEVILLLRVAERPHQPDPARIFYPHMTEDGQLVVREISRRNGRFDLSDPRLIRDLHTGHTLLTSISHIRLARSADGLRFTIDEQPWLAAEPPFESFGIEDARVTRIGESYYINYSAVSAFGISTGLVSTRDFVHIQRHGIIFSPANRDVTIFPEQIDGQYVCYHRPMPSPFGGLHIWMATSPDLRHWGAHRLVLQSQPGGWESGRVGGGAPPLHTDQGWLSIYHAADHQQRYCLGAFLTPLDDPGRITRRSLRPILSPEASYETTGFFPQVVFTCGALLQDGLVRVYYGASDNVSAIAEAPLSDLLQALSAV